MTIIDDCHQKFQDEHIPPCEKDTDCNIHEDNSYTKNDSTSRYKTPERCEFVIERVQECETKKHDSSIKIYQDQSHFVDNDNQNKINEIINQDTNGTNKSGYESYTDA